MKRIHCLLLLVTLLPFVAVGHKKDSIPTPYHWNTIKINPTPALLFSNLSSITLSYERMVKKNQSFQVQLGYLHLNPLFGDSLGGFFDVKRIKDNGINVAFDYRFYLLHRNEYPAPDGLYLGGYLSYYGFNFRDQFWYNGADSIKTIGEFGSSFNLANLGVELGYQFIFWKKLSVDLLLFGPSMTFSTANWSVSTDLPTEIENEVIAKVKDKFNEKYPLLSPVIDPTERGGHVEFKLFFRYSISIGFHF